MRTLKAIVGIVGGAFVGIGVSMFAFVGYYEMTGRESFDDSMSALVILVMASATLFGAAIGGILCVRWWWQTLVGLVVLILGIQLTGSHFMAPIINDFLSEQSKSDS